METVRRELRTTGDKPALLRLITSASVVFLFFAVANSVVRAPSPGDGTSPGVVLSFIRTYGLAPSVLVFAVLTGGLWLARTIFLSRNRANVAT